MLSTWLRGFIVSPGRLAGSGLAGLTHLLWPWSCQLCGAASAAPAAGPLCVDCLECLRAEVRNAQVHMAGVSGSADDAEYGRTARRSQDLPTGASATIAVACAGYYERRLLEAIRVWKFRGRFSLSPVLAELAAEALARQEWAASIDGFVPIPQSWMRWLGRRFHPAGELACGVAAAAGRPVWPILRARHHRQQVGLSRDERLRNMRGVFRLASPVNLSGRTICLIDDVTTTGATLEAAAAVLVSAGASRVYATVVAKALGTGLDAAWN